VLCPLCGFSALCALQTVHVGFAVAKSLDEQIKVLDLAWPDVFKLLEMAYLFEEPLQDLFSTVQRPNHVQGIRERFNPSVPVFALGTTLRQTILALGLRPSATPRVQGRHPKGYAQELRPKATLKRYAQRLPSRATPKCYPQELRLRAHVSRTKGDPKS
jgi:hypothetical protein